MLWLLGGLAPTCSVLVYNKAKQPTQLINNSYEYLVEKRSATVNLQSNNMWFIHQPFASSKEFQTLRSQLSASDRTLYELENDMVS